LTIKLDQLVWKERCPHREDAENAEISHREGGEEKIGGVKKLSIYLSLYETSAFSAPPQ